MNSECPVYIYVLAQHYYTSSHGCTGVTVTQSFSSAEQVVGEDYTVTCVVSGGTTGTITFEWYKDTYWLPEETSNTLSFNPLRESSPTSNGRYLCGIRMNGQDCSCFGDVFQISVRGKSELRVSVEPHRGHFKTRLLSFIEKLHVLFQSSYVRMYKHSGRVNNLENQEVLYQRFHHRACTSWDWNCGCGPNLGHFFPLGLLMISNRIHHVGQLCHEHASDGIKFNYNHVLGLYYQSPQPLVLNTLYSSTSTDAGNNSRWTAYRGTGVLSVVWSHGRRVTGSEQQEV